jgi:predicted enzyme related to lactoylglutathione lyase
MILGLRTVIYHVPDLDKAKAWYARVFDVQPYFNQPFYVGFNIAGYELGLEPDTGHAQPGSGGVVAYWGVSEIEEAVRSFLTQGATLSAAVQEVGGGIKVATVRDPFGNFIGLIENPHFTRDQTLSAAAASNA